jgi:threonine aldolase
MLDTLVDLRSDTVTRPTDGMRHVLSMAPVGDDVYGEDPSVNELEALAAEIVGKEAALFVPSGTMANLISLMLHTRPGDEVVLGQDSHCMRFEAGGGAAIAGAQFNVVPGDGRFTADQVRARLREQTLHSPGTVLIWIENTHNLSGGRVFPLHDIRKISELARERGIALHMDGARIFNAAIATGVAVRDIAADVGSLSFCLSKGLGAPVGSVLCGSADFRRRAHRLRKRLGGAMRQAGILAAAGIYALQNHVGRMIEDHVLAVKLARGLAEIPGLEVDAEAVETNIVMAKIRPGWGTPTELETRCREQGVLFHSVDDERMRLVTHLDVDARAIDRAVETIHRELSPRRA